MTSTDGELVSVVLPVLNAVTTIDAQLAALAHQDDEGPWELVVSDNGSTDGTLARLRLWSPPLPLRTVDASGRRGVGHARNIGVQAAMSDRILMCDADDVVSRSWRRGLARTLVDHELATGPLERCRLNARYHERWSWPALTSEPRVPHGYLPFAPSQNLAFRRHLFEDLGGFDAGLRRGEDMDFVWRAIRSGAQLGFAAEAVVHVGLRPTAPSALRQGLVDGLYEPLLYRRHGPSGMPREEVSAVLHSYRQLAAALPDAVVRRRQTLGWAYDVGQRMGRLVGSVRYGRLFP